MTLLLKPPSSGIFYNPTASLNANLQIDQVMAKSACSTIEKPKTPKITTGYRYGNWVITGEPERINRDLRYPCQCICGTVRLVSAISLRNGTSTSCGCLHKEVMKRMASTENRLSSSHVQDILKMISQGILPPADQFSIKDGSPSWSLLSIAKILGINIQELIDHLHQAGKRFSEISPDKRK